MIVSFADAVTEDLWINGRSRKIPANMTRVALRKLAQIDLCPTFIAPSSDEGVCISFETGKRYADIECYNSGEVYAMTSLPYGKPTIWQVRDINETGTRIHSFIAS